MVAILSLIRNSSPTHRCSIHRCFSVTHSEYRYTPYTAFILIFKNQIQLQLEYAPDTDAIPLLIQTQSPDTTQIHFKYGYHSDVHSTNFQPTILDGIFKPISSKILPSPNGISKPILPTIVSPTANFWAL